MLTVLNQYRAIKNNIADFIKASGYRNDYVAKKLGISAQSFAVKKQRNNWNDEEVEKIMEIIDNEDVQNYYAALMIKTSKSGKAISSDEFEKAMQW